MPATVANITDQAAPLLALDTCGPESTVALCRPGAEGLTVLGTRTLAPRTAASLLTPTLQELLEETGLSPRELGAVLVVDGPGSFTGIRLGLSTAKALAEGLGLRLFAISRLRVLAHTYAAAAAALDAGRGEVFLGRYPDGHSPCEQLCLASVAAEFAHGEALVFSEPRLAPLLPHARLVPAPTALDAAAAAMLSPGPYGADPLTLEGRYLRTDLYGPPA